MEEFKYLYLYMNVNKVGMSLLTLSLSLYLTGFLYKNVFVSKHDVNYYLEKFTTLKDDFNFEEGKYKAYYENADTFNTLTYFFVVSIWHGFTYKDGKINQDLRIGNETSTKVEMKKSTMDSKKALVITFEDRYYEIRPYKRKLGTYLSIVRRISTNEILDIHTLEKII